MPEAVTTARTVARDQTSRYGFELLLANAGGTAVDGVDNEGQEKSRSPEVSGSGGTRKMSIALCSYEVWLPRT
jgi:hypothetical protein